MLQDKMTSLRSFPSSRLGTHLPGSPSFLFVTLVFLLLLSSTAAFARDKIGIDLEWRPITGLGPAPPTETTKTGSGTSRTSASGSGERKLLKKKEFLYSSSPTTSSLWR